MLMFVMERPPLALNYKGKRNEWNELVPTSKV